MKRWPLHPQPTSHATASNLDRVADLVLGGVEDYELSEQWGVEVWAALEKMQKSLRKAGFKRPVRQPNPKPVKQQQAGFELNQQWRARNFHTGDSRCG